MAVNKSELKQDILEAMNAVSDVGIDPAVAREQQAEAFADAFIKQIKNIDAVVTNIVTAGSATTQTQTVPVKAQIS